MTPPVEYAIAAAPHVFGVPAAILLAALGGALVGALQRSKASWLARFTGLLSGFLGALFCTPAVAGLLMMGRTPALETLVGLAFVLGCAGNALTTQLTSDPWAFLWRYRAKKENDVDL